MVNVAEIVSAIASVSAIVLTIAGSAIGVAIKIGRVISKLDALHEDFVSHRAEFATTKKEQLAMSTANKEAIKEVSDRLHVVESACGKGCMNYSPGNPATGGT